MGDVGYYIAMVQRFGEIDQEYSQVALMIGHQGMNSC